jgi:hypothetical protein
VKICLYALVRISTMTTIQKWTMPHRNQKIAAKKPIPGVLGVVTVSMVKEYWPLISWDGQFAASQLLLGSGRGKVACFSRKLQKSTYSTSDQSSPAGHSRAPVRSWLKPRLDFTFRAKGGFSGSPRGIIQSRMVPFKLLVSSALADALPFWIFPRNESQDAIKSRTTRTSSPICLRSSLEPSIRRSSNPGMESSNFWKIRCSLRTLEMRHNH